MEAEVKTASQRTGDLAKDGEVEIAGRFLCPTGAIPGPAAIRVNTRGYDRAQA